jgi:signal transduction histidine kinase
VISHPAGFAIAQYGVRTPAPGLLIPSLLVCGLLIGGYFLSTWTAVCCLLLLSITLRVGTITEAATIRALAFWWLLFATTGWLVHLFTDHLERRWQVEHRQTSALGRMLAVMSAEQPLEGLLSRLAALLREEFDADAVTLCRYSAAADQLEVAATSRKGAAVVEADSAIAARDLPAWREVNATPRALPIARPATDSRVSGWPVLFSARTEQLLIVPIVINSVPAGLLAIDYARALRDQQEETDLAGILARELALFFQIEQLTHSQRQAAVLEERNRMAREIHDSLAQGFTGIVVQLNAAEEMLQRQPDASRQHLDTARKLARSSLEEARRSVRALLPQSLEQEGLAASLARIARELTAGSRMVIDLQISGTPPVLTADMELNILRVGQEALTNAVRHSRCDRVVVRLSHEPDAIRLVVRDNGSGILSSEPGPDVRRGTGLPGMRERARRLNGNLQIEGAPGTGTTITLVVPLR